MGAIRFACMFKFKKNKNQKGFSLAEMLIVFAVLSIVLSAIVSYFVSVVRVQNYILASQQLYDQTSYAMDYMYKMIRMAKKDASPETCATDKYNFNPINPTGATSLQFIRIDRTTATPTRICQRFNFDAGTGIISTYTSTASPVTWATNNLTSGDIKVTNLKFVISGDGGTAGGDKNQPKVTILLEAQSVKVPDAKIRLQTTVSQRDLDVDL